MDNNEFSNGFDVLYNNITSNQAPGLNEYEKSVFLTKGQEELVKNYFNPKSNSRQDGFESTPKRQADFSTLLETDVMEEESSPVTLLNRFSKSYIMGTDIFIILNEQLQEVKKNVAQGTANPRALAPQAIPTDEVDGDYGTGTHTEASSDNLTITEYGNVYTVVPISYDEYTRLMSKPYKFPPKNIFWRLITSSQTDNNDIQPRAELIGRARDNWELIYTIRYVKRPDPIVLVNLNTVDPSLKIHGENTETPCKLPEHLHEEILQRAVELAKVAWTATGQDNTQLMIQTGDRSE